MFLEQIGKLLESKKLNEMESPNWGKKSRRVGRDIATTKQYLGKNSKIVKGLEELKRKIDKKKSAMSLSKKLASLIQSLKGINESKSEDQLRDEIKQQKEKNSKQNKEILARIEEVEQRLSMLKDTGIRNALQQHLATLKKELKGESLKESKKKVTKNPCWDGYEMVGHKKKNGKKVPNCVPKKEAKNAMKMKVEEGIPDHAIYNEWGEWEYFTDVLFEEKGNLKESKTDERIAHLIKHMDLQPSHKKFVEGTSDFKPTKKEIAEAFKINTKSKYHIKNIDVMYDDMMDIYRWNADITRKNQKEMLEEKGKTKEKKVKLNKPFRNGDGPKKFSVYVKNDKGNVVKVNFGDENMEIKRDDPERRKSFRARHNCSEPGPKWKARYWSCKMWQKGKSVGKMLESKRGCCR